MAQNGTNTVNVLREDRHEVTETLCEHLNWLTPAGLPKTTACTKLLNRLEAQAIIRLPPKRKRAAHAGRCTQSVPREAELTGEQAPLERSLAELGPVRLVPVTEKAAQGLWNGYVARYHYLG